MPAAAILGILALGLAPSSGAAARFDEEKSFASKIAVLFANGPIVTDPGGGYGGADASALQTILSLETYGFGQQFSEGRRVADEFTISDPQGWRIDTVYFLAYQNGSGTTSPITGVYLQIWDGRPGDPGSSVIFGDLTTNRMTGTTWSNIYRVPDYDWTSATRPVMANIVAVNLDLAAGTYWLDWMTDGSASYTGPWAPPITILDQTTTGNARQYDPGTSSWNDATDSGTGTQQGFPFVIEGSLTVATPSPTAIAVPSPTPSCGPDAEKLRDVIASGDYNGDGTAEIAIFRPSTILWSVQNLTRVCFGGSSDIPAPADYDGDGTAEIAIFRAASSLWSVRGLTRAYYGVTGDLAVSQDYGGDGSAAIAVFRESSGQWLIRDLTRFYFGQTGDWPVPGYYTGDGTLDVGVYRPGAGMWAVRGLTRAYFGQSDDWPVPADYAGDGAWRPTVFRPCRGMWALKDFTRIYFGNCLDVPRPADFNGDGMDEFGIFRSSEGLWAVRNLTRTYFGATGDVPVTR